MNLHRIGLFIALLTTAIGTANAQDVCPSYSDRVLEPITIDAALAKLKGAQLKKDEFETTAQFETRQRTAISGGISDLIISKDVDLQYIKYDADTQTLTIQTYLFDNANVNYDVLEYPKPLPFGTLSNIDVVISETETSAGTFEAANSYGAKATVTRINRVTKAIWDRPSSSFSGELFATGKNGSTLVSLKLDPDKARFIKSQVRTSFLVSPKPPFVLSGHGPVGQTTVSRPVQVTNDLTLMIADIKCAFLTDGSNKVLGSFPIG